MMHQRPSSLMKDTQHADDPPVHEVLLLKTLCVVTRYHFSKSSHIIILSMLMRRHHSKPSQIRYSACWSCTNKPNLLTKDTQCGHHTPASQVFVRKTSVWWSPTSKPSLPTKDTQSGDHAPASQACLQKTLSEVICTSSQSRLTIQHSTCWCSSSSTPSLLR